MVVQPQWLGVALEEERRSSRQFECHLFYAAELVPHSVGGPARRTVEAGLDTRIRKQRVHLGITYESIAASLEVIVTYHYCAGRVVCATEEVGIRGEVLSTVPPAHSGDKTGDSVHEVAPGTVDCGFMRLR